MKFKKYLLITVFIIYCNTLYGLNANDIIAYPVPFNPKTKTLTIGTSTANSIQLSGLDYSVNVSIYDINGDLIIKKSTSGTKIMWNGRNRSGRIVKPGLYILKVELESESNPSDYIKKMFRILVDY